MGFDIKQFHQVFFEEAQEHLDSMEKLLLSLDIETPDADEVNAIFRAAHSIKGGGATFGFADVAELTHALESLLDKVRKNELALTTEIVDASLVAGDTLKNYLAGHREGAVVDRNSGDAVIARLKALAGGQTAPSPRASSPPAAAAVATEAAEREFEVLFRPRADGSQDKFVVSLQEELARMGCVAQSEDFTAQGQRTISHRIRTGASQDDIVDVLEFIAEPDQYEVIPLTLASSDIADEGEGYGLFVTVADAQPAVEEGDGYGFFVDPVALRQPAAADSVGFFAAPPSASPAAPIISSPAPAVASPVGAIETAAPAAPVAPATKPEATIRRRQSDKDEAASIRVGVEKVDQLINLVGELVITHAMLAQTVSTLDPVLNEKLLDGMGQLERNSRDLQEAVLSIRMMPIGFVFSRFPRMVRDLAAQLGKKIALETIGEGTELDKGLIEKISDPLTHLVRNCIDHGIETPEKRLAAGKDEVGRMTLQASHRGGNIVIEVADDGAGLDRERILAKARERGIEVAGGAADAEVWSLIFAPGFSTAEIVTDVSGRGVGMDVVKRNIEAMGGRVEICSATGRGTRMTIRLPLTLAILDGMSIGLGGETYIIPLTCIVESIKPDGHEIKPISGSGKVINVRGDYLPIIELRELFGIHDAGRSVEDGVLVIIESDGRKTALLVDELLGQHQVVIKNLETNYRRVYGVSGATIMGDGHVALILDAPSLINLSLRQGSES